MHITLVVAAGTNNAIGKNNQLLWHLPADMRFFKNTTWAMPVIMGRKTFESIGKPLQGRANIILSQDPGWQAQGAEVANTLDMAIALAIKRETKEIFIIGGGKIYELAMPIANRVWMTRVETSPEADTFFPPLDPIQWKLVFKKEHPKDEKNRLDFSFECWERSMKPSE